MVRVLEGLLQKHQVQHMLRRGSRFSNAQLEGASLFVIDDVQQIAKTEAALLRTLAGRDKIGSDIKYSKEIMIQPRCTTVIVSNFLSNDSQP